MSDDKDEEAVKRGAEAGWALGLALKECLPEKRELAVKAAIAALTLLLANPAFACRLHSIWHYHWPERCAAVHPRALMRPAPTQVALQTPAAVTSVTPVTAADEPGPRVTDLDELEIQLDELWLRRAALIYPDLPQ